MNLIEFKNLPDTTTPINADNLNLLQSNVEESINELNSKLIGTVLFSNNSGTKENITLSDNSANYDFLEVYFGGANRGSIQIVKVDHKHNGYVNLMANGFSSELSRNYIYNSRYQVSGNRMTLTEYHTETTIYSESITNANIHNIFVYKIVGYKYI